MNIGDDIGIGRIINIDQDNNWYLIECSGVQQQWLHRKQLSR